MLKTWFIFLIFSGLLLSFQASAYITVKSVKAAKNSVVVKLSEQDEVSVGMSLEYKDPNGNPCVVKVVKIKNMLAMAEATMCDNIKVLRPGKTLEIQGATDFDSRRQSSEIGSGHSARKKRGTLSGLVFGGRLYYSLAEEIYSSYKDFGAEFKMLDKTSGAIGLGLNLAYITNSSIMFGLGGSYEMERKLTSRQYSNGATAKYSNGESIGLIVMDLKLGYVFKKSGILFVGLNTNSPMLTNMENLKAAGDLGYNFGLIYVMESKISIDIEWRILSMKISENERTYDLTAMDNACIGLGYIF